MINHSPAPTPSRSVYGFVMYLSSYSLLLLYLVWAFVPSSMLHSLGLTYFPQKYWALALPVFVCCSIVIFALFIYPGLTFLLTPPLSSVNTIVDNFSRSKRDSVPGSIPPVYDMSISEVNQRLFKN